MTPTEIGRMMRAKMALSKGNSDGRMRFATMADYERWKAQQELG